MRFWIREVAGSALVVLGLLVFYLCVALLFAADKNGRPTPRILEAGILTVIGIFVFRGGIHLLKVAVAARICWQTQERLQETRPGTAHVPRRTNFAQGAGRNPSVG